MSAVLCSFFDEVDENRDGNISQKELTGFVASYGFNHECFEEAFRRASILSGTHPRRAI